MAFAVFFLAEYANMILIAALTVVMFLGGWLPPVDIAPFNWIPPVFWFGLKTSAVAFPVPMVPGNFSQLSLRSDHAAGLESFNSGHAGLDFTHGYR